MERSQVSLRRIFAATSLFAGSLACARVVASRPNELWWAPIELTAGVLLLAASAGVLFHRPLGFGVTLAIVVLVTLALFLFFFWLAATGRLQ